MKQMFERCKWIFLGIFGGRRPLSWPQWVNRVGYSVLIPLVLIVAFTGKPASLVQPAFTCLIKQDELCPVLVLRDMQYTEVALRLAVPEQALRALNPQLNGEAIPAGTTVFVTGELSFRRHRRQP